ncbi:MULTISPECIES: hypothetical protein [Myxococcus]|uniref:hypothetical protein n=1 Tax=Myxococcus TaxID=32 RepID=UPI00112986B2|nr:MULTISPECIES: hypothetical protein [Myxococcus]QDE85138.1 hypothetical protein BHS07_28415 [Myxococcus xanthus]QDF06995.1 hypothetical protein BHS04_27960 [Myxococcus xanthus]WAM24607.1 hypothetical protein OZ403_29320 [Myxococcus sp. NMCA1]
MRYELLLQTMTPGSPYEAARVDALLSERGVVARPDGVRRWSFKNGDVDIGELREGGQVVATELRVPLSDRPDLMREAVEAAAALASEAGVRLVDPQLGRSLTGNDDAGVMEQYVRTARYAGEVAGVPEAMGAGSYALETEGSRGFQLSTRMVLIAIGIFVALYLVVDSLVGQLGGR